MLTFAEGLTRKIRSNLSTLLRMITNNQIRFVKSLQQKKYRTENGLFVVEGLKLFEELNLSDFQIHSAYGLTDLAEQFDGVEAVKLKELERMSGLKSAPPIIAVAHKKEWRKESLKGLTILLDDLNDPGNLGTIIRSADWFGVSRVICSPKTVEVYNSKGIQASMGSVFNVPVFVQEMEETIADLNELKIPVYGTSLKGKDISELKTTSDCALIIGSESHGMRPGIENLCDENFKIPGFGKAESLNAAVACSVFLAQLKI